jgi:hypothetical protein
MMEQPEGYRDPRVKNTVEFIELLNDVGMTIVKIDHVYYNITGDFRPADEITNITTLKGSNVTDKILNAIAVAQFQNDALLKTRITQEIMALPSLRREFHHKVEWTKFVAKGA